MYFISYFPGFRGELEEREKIMICKGQSSSEILPPTPTAIFHEKILPPQNVNTNLSLEVQVRPYIGLDVDTNLLTRLFFVAQFSIDSL